METSIVIPDHVIEEILLRLPVKELLRWKCVSKHWYALIWGDNFIKKHYEFHYDMHLAVHGDVPLLLNTISYNSEPTQLHLVSKDGERYVADNITAEFERDTAHVFPCVPPLISEPRCLGIVNGVLCLQEDHNHMALWNPATREIKDVPGCPMTDHDESTAVFKFLGFGFDLQSNDFKILGRINTWTPGVGIVSTVEFHIYSLNADSWKRITNTLRTNMFLFCSTTDAYFKNGVYYWVAAIDYDVSMYRIVSFNCSSEIFKEFELPASAETWVDCRLRIGKYKEGLALLVQTLKSNETCFEIWTVTKFRDDEYEVPSSWQLVVKVPAIYVANGLWLSTVLDCGDILIIIQPPITYDEVAEGDGNFARFGAHIYNPSTRTFNYLGFRINSSYKYVESMFPLSRRPIITDMAL